MKVKQATVKIELTQEETNYLVELITDLPWDVSINHPIHTILKKLTED